VTDKKSETKPVRGEVLPPTRAQNSLPRLSAPPGIPVVVQAQYWAARRKLEAYTKTVAAQTATFQALEARERARVSFERALVQAENLEDIRLIEELKIVEELASLVAGSEVREFRTRALKAQAEAEAISAERRLEALKKSSSAAGDGGKSGVAADIARMRKEAVDLKKAIIECYGGEEAMSEEDRNLLEEVDVQLRNKIVERLENL
jgi:hypothetical protein